MGLHVVHIPGRHHPASGEAVRAEGMLPEELEPEGAPSRVVPALCGSAALALTLALVLGAAGAATN
jgi:hypothetical protein